MSTTAFEGRRRSRSTRQLCLYTTVHSLQSRGSPWRPTDNEGSRAAYLPDIIPSAPAAPVRASLARSPLMHVQTTALVHAFVTSRLDYCNSMLAGIRDGLIDQLQIVLRVAALLVLRKRKFDPILADIRDRLHWLPIRSRIDFKLGLLVCKCLHGIAPAYLTEMLVQKSTVPALSRLRSTARGDLLVPRTKTKTIGPRSFATSGPALWNNLPDDLRDPSLSLTVFKQRLKSYLFKPMKYIRNEVPKYILQGLNNLV